MFRILYQDDDLIAIDKPKGFFVHPPEDQRHRIPRSKNALWCLRNQINQFLYPVHRLDGATSGVLLYALSQESARKTHLLFQTQKIQKTYLAVTRGWTCEKGTFSSEIKDEFGNKKEAITHYQRLAKIELPFHCGKYPNSRYSLVLVHPKTGRHHQIRRHFANHSHPLIGDSSHGDLKHNRYFKNELGIEGLLLKAYCLELKHPISGKHLKIISKFNHVWHKVFQKFQLCAWTPK